MQKRDWNAIDTVLLDMDGTLLDLHFDTYFWLHHMPSRYAEIHNTSVDKALEHVEPIFDSERGKLSWYCVDYWTKQTSLDIAALKNEIAHLIKIRPHVIEFLAALRNSGKHAVIVTNAHHKSIAIKMRETLLGEHVDGIYSSHDYGVAKESPLFWQRLQETLDFDPKRTLFIDDSLAVLHSARDFGIEFLLTLQQPDSKMPRRNKAETDGFASIHHFDEIMPVIASPTANISI